MDTSASLCLSTDATSAVSLISLLSASFTSSAASLSDLVSKSLTSDFASTSLTSRISVSSVLSVDSSLTSDTDALTVSHSVASVSLDFDSTSLVSSMGLSVFLSMCPFILSLVSDSISGLASSFTSSEALFSSFSRLSVSAFSLTVLSTLSECRASNFVTL